jgi:retron-type reverse transcriptase
VYFLTHPIKSQQFTTQQGATFLGFRILPNHIRVRTENLRRAKRRIRRLQTGYAKNTVTVQQISQSLQSWFAHLKSGDTWKLRQKLHASLPFSERIAIDL